MCAERGRTLSAFEDYDSTSASYDGTRSALGIEVILGALAAAGRDLETLTVLDAGCGTGNYASALAPHVGTVIGLDLSAGMLAAARAKLDADPGSGRVLLGRARLDRIPLADGSVDAVCVNQVLHHVGDVDGGGWTAVRTVIAELARVLVPGGILVVNLCSRRQLEVGWWYPRLVPHAAAAMRARHIPLDELEHMCDASGLDPIARWVPADLLMQGEHYFDTFGPARAEWRAGDSLWALVEPAELEAALDHLERLRARGEIDDFVAEADREREHVGQLTFVVARRRG